MKHTEKSKGVYFASDVRVKLIIQMYRMHSLYRPLDGWIQLVDPILTLQLPFFFSFSLLALHYPKSAV